MGRSSTALGSSGAGVDWRAVWISGGILAAAMVLYLVRWDSAEEFAASIDHADRLFVDFELFYYPAGQALFTDQLPPRSFLYSGSFALFMAIFGSLPYPIALWLWGLLQMALVALTPSSSPAAVPRWWSTT